MKHNVNILEGKIERKEKVGTPRRTWTKVILEWTGRRTYELMKTEAGEREGWKTIVNKYGYEAVGKKERMYVNGKLIDVNLLFEVDK